MSYGQQAGMTVPTNVKRYYEADLWSSRFFAQGSATANGIFDLYSSSIGSTATGFPAPLTIAETNMVESNRIATGLAFTVRQVAIEPMYDDATSVCQQDLRNVLNVFVPVWKFLNTDIEIAPVALIGQGGGVFGTTADTGAVEGTTGSRIALNNGASSTWVYHELPVLLPANTNFRLQLRTGQFGQAVDGGAQDANMIIRGHCIGVATSAVPEG